MTIDGLPVQIPKGMARNSCIQNPVDRGAA
jgi:hypothetical protein